LVTPGVKPPRIERHSKEIYLQLLCFLTLGDWVVFLQVSFSPFTFGHEFSKLETLIIKEAAPNMRENHALGVVYNPCAVL
jgi:hypothetical protein